jgi:hypothetical protein
VNFLKLPEIEDLRITSDFMAQKRKAQEAFGGQKSEFIRLDLVSSSHVTVRPVERVCGCETCKAVGNLIASASVEVRPARGST